MAKTGKQAQRHQQVVVGRGEGGKREGQRQSGSLERGPGNAPACNETMA
jgi:hypothetical protein